MMDGFAVKEEVRVRTDQDDALAPSRGVAVAVVVGAGIWVVIGLLLYAIL